MLLFGRTRRHRPRMRCYAAANGLLSSFRSVSRSNIPPNVVVVSETMHFGLFGGLCIYVIKNRSIEADTHAHVGKTKPKLSCDDVARVAIASFVSRHTTTLGFFWTHPHNNTYKSR